jgi:signal transduction histidine kinase
MIILFVYIGYAIFNTFRKAEQNQVWAGMAKETAHQLGTPLSSLIGWVEYLDTQDVDKSIPAEMKKDVDRLVKVADRFSKIGSETHLENSDLLITVNSVMTYLRPRISKKVEISVNASQHEIIVPYNISLIEWVIENIAKNAVDAMENVGKLSIHLSQTEKETIIDFTDTGKGVAAQHFQKIFKPGFTSKKRGWGLGLSLVKRIITVYHKGNVFVLKSELNKGTTMRICLNNNTKG